MKRGLDRCEALQKFWVKVRKNERSESNRLTVLFSFTFRRLGSGSVLHPCTDVK
jgi:hypothetical protein